MNSRTILDVSDLSIHLQGRQSIVTPVDGVSFKVDEGEVLGIVGESGSGKSLTLRSLIGLLPGRGSITGTIREAMSGGELTPYDPVSSRGRGVSIVFQDPQSALNPTMRVGRFIEEGVRKDAQIAPRKRYERVIELMELVGISDAEKRSRMWPHQLSGGMRQRIMIAAALATRPSLLLCDEPTTALDVSVQDQILGLFMDLRQRFGMAIVFVSHDMAVIGELCDRIAVMYAGNVVELGAAQEVLRTPAHPYTAALIESIPSFSEVSDALVGIPGRPPDPQRFPEGCRFRDRCRFSQADCSNADRILRSVKSTHWTACLHPEVLLDNPS